MSATNSTKSCTFEGCDRPIKSTGLCGGHYQQRSAGKTLKPLIVKKYTPRPKRLSCVHCELPGSIRFKGGSYCIVHYRAKQMRYDAQASGKVVPSKDEIAALLSGAIAGGLICPVCKRAMNWTRAEGHSTIVTLQHDRSGAFRLICLGCNVRHQHTPGDGFYDLPQGHKWCRGCDTTKPLTEFYRHKGCGAVERTTLCRKCILAEKKQERQDNGDAIREYWRRWRAANREKINNWKRTNRAKGTT